MKDLYALFRQSLAGLRLLIAATLLLGVIYPLLVTGIGAAIAPWRANGSLVTSTGEHTTSASEAVGSELIGQQVGYPTLFQPRPSAAGEGYDTLSTYGSNYGPESPELIAAIKERQAEIAEREGAAVSEIPADAVTASASGLDPHISVAYAELQIARVAEANDLDPAAVGRLVDEHTTGRALGVLGEPAVNVLTLNIDLLQLADPS